MDEDLKRLERAFRESPDDVVVARAYQAALLRVGQRETVRELYAFKFQCPVSWEALAPGPHALTRHCGECGKDVHRVRDARSLRDHVAAGNCVAVPDSLRERFFDAVIDSPRNHVAADPDASCVMDWGRPMKLGEIAALPEATA